MTTRTRCKCGRYVGDAPCRFCEPIAYMLYRAQARIARWKREKRIKHNIDDLFIGGRMA